VADTVLGHQVGGEGSDFGKIHRDIEPYRAGRRNPGLDHSKLAIAFVGGQE
jgi:hypothetical protein